MLKKLMKYEFRSCARYLVPIYIAMIAIFTINSGLIFASVNNSFDNDLIRIIMIMASFTVFIILSIASIYVVAKRFAKGVFGDEGYLTNTLPVTNNQIIASKTIVLTTYSLITFLVVILSLIIMVLPSLISSPDFTFGKFFGQIAKLAAQNNVNIAKYASIGFISLIISSLSSTIIVFMCVSIAHLKSFVQHKYLVGILTYVLLSIITNIVSIPLYETIFTSNDTVVSYVNPTGAEVMGSLAPVMDKFLLALNIETLIIAILGYALIYYIMNNRLNLE